MRHTGVCFFVQIVEMFQKSCAELSYDVCLDTPFQVGFHGVMVSTLDSESSDPSSNLGGTFKSFFCLMAGQLSLGGQRQASNHNLP